jgi:ATP-dependent helicase/DNAse subunit B
VTSFRKQLLEKSFSATGIWPMEQEVITQRFMKKAANQGNDSSNEASANRPNTWLQLEHLLRAAVAGESSESAQKLSELLYHLQVDNELVHGKNEGLREALVVNKEAQEAWPSS